MTVPIARTFHILLVDQDLKNQQHWLPCWHVTFQYAFTFRSGSSIFMFINSTLLIFLSRQMRSSIVPASNSHENVEKKKLGQEQCFVSSYSWGFYEGSVPLISKCKSFKNSIRCIKACAWVTAHLKAWNNFYSVYSLERSLQDTHNGTY